MNLELVSTTIRGRELEQELFTSKSSELLRLCRLMILPNAGEEIWEHKLHYIDYTI